MIRINLQPQRPPPPRGGSGPPPALWLVLWVAALNAWLTVYHRWALCDDDATMHRVWGLLEFVLLALAVYALYLLRSCGGLLRRANRAPLVGGAESGDSPTNGRRC
jgi:hypothetical protein